MNQPLVVLAGATGDLGGRVVRELISMNTKVRALVRKETPEEKKQRLCDQGVEVVEVASKFFCPSLAS